MNRNELIAKIAEAEGIPRKAVGAVLDAFVAEVRKVGEEAGKLRLVGLGTFEGVDRPARTARNPATGESVEVPARRVLRFKPSKTAAG